MFEKKETRLPYVKCKYCEIVFMDLPLHFYIIYLGGQDEVGR